MSASRTLINFGHRDKKSVAGEMKWKWPLFQLIEQIHILVSISANQRSFKLISSFFRYENPGVLGVKMLYYVLTENLTKYIGRPAEWEWDTLLESRLDLKRG